MAVDKFNLNKKVAIVTGGGGLLGAQHTEALILSGAHVYVADIDYDSANQVCLNLGTKATPLLLDVTSEKSITDALEKILQDKGRLDILINNAAIDPKVNNNSIIETSRVENFNIDDWHFQLNVGLLGSFLCSKVFGSWMSTNNGGVILNIASDLSVFSPDQRIYKKNNGLPEEEQPVKPVTYSVIKHGLIGLTKYLSTYWTEKNIRVNALSPGGVYTNQTDEFVEKLTNLIPMARMAHADEYQSAVQFLCSDASSYMTGQNIVIDGGRSVL
mgnify:FL=1